jgi:hypothetical protein
MDIRTYINAINLYPYIRGADWCHQLAGVTFFCNFADHYLIGGKYIKSNLV